MKGYVFDPVAKEIRWQYGSRKVMSSTGKLLELLPASYDYSGTVTFSYPDPPKGKPYLHQWQVERVFQSGNFFYGRASRCVAWVGVKPQEWEQQSKLAGAPGEADFAALLVSAKRTVAPSHNWGGEAVAALPEQEVYIPFTGSLLMEAVPAGGFLRAMSIIIDDGDLVLHREQSVSVAPGGFTSRSYSDGTNIAYGSDWYAVGGASTPVYAGTGSPWRRNVGDTRPDGSMPGPLLNCDRGGAAECSASDPTDYGSTWRLNIIAMFGSYSRIV